MFDILHKSLETGVVTTSYPRTNAEISKHARGQPQIDFPNWKDARSAAAICPTGAISYRDELPPAPHPALSPSDGVRVSGRTGEGQSVPHRRTVALDLGKCIFCGLCADVDPAIRMTNTCELATRRRDRLISIARYQLKEDGTHHHLLDEPEVGSPAVESATFATKGQKLKDRIDQILGRSLHIREVDAGSCNGCEIEIVGLSSPIYDIERFGIHFVASPRHADMLLVTGPVTRNMESALRKTYAAMPAPRLVVAVGACGCSGGIFGQNYATCGGVDQVIPVDVYIPGCPPNPHALLHGILLAVGRMPEKLAATR